MPRNIFKPGIFNHFKSRIPACLHFLTDIEGNFQALAHSVKNSTVVKFNHQGQLDFKKRDNPYFIFGGDLTDRGFDDERLLATLLDFKRRYPHRVALIVGNREAAKTRFSNELDSRWIKQRLFSGKPPLFAKTQVTPLSYVRIYQRKKHPQNDLSIDKYIQQLSDDECQVIYLKWMLEYNLGCPDLYEIQALKLAHQFRCKREDVTDKMVLNHLQQLYAPTGLLGEYLKNTQMAALIPGTGVLALHGALTTQNIGRLPNLDASIRNEDIQIWLEELNQWYAKQIAQWSQGKLSDGFYPDTLSPPYQFPQTEGKPFCSITTATWLNESRQFENIHEDVAQYLERNRVNLVLSGHQPIGQIPVIQRARNGRVIFLNGDISYAHVSKDKSFNTRGDAWYSVDINVGLQSTGVAIKAKPHLGPLMNRHLKLAYHGQLDDAYIGKVLPNGELVQYKSPRGLNYLTVRLQGYRVIYQERSTEEIRSMLGIQKTPDFMTMFHF